MYSIVTHDCNCQKSPGHKRGFVGSYNWARRVRVLSLAGGECGAACNGDQRPRLGPFGWKTSLCTVLTPSCHIVARFLPRCPRWESMGPGLMDKPWALERTLLPGGGVGGVCTGWGPARSGHTLARLSRNDSPLSDSVLSPCSGPCSQTPKGAAAPRQAFCGINFF